jgi:hypothetical protein
VSSIAQPVEEERERRVFKDVRAVLSMTQGEEPQCLELRPCLSWMLMVSRKSFALHSPSSNPGSITDIADRRL